jgi:hypothetical protein
MDEKDRLRQIARAKQNQELLVFPFFANLLIVCQLWLI